MTHKTIVVASPNSTQRDHISGLIEDMPDFHVVARTGDLMNTYNQVEARLPSAVLISDSLASLPEFEVMRALFSALDVRWLVLTTQANSHKSAIGSNTGSDLFSVPGFASASIIEGQLRSLTRSEPHRLPAAQRSEPAKPTAQPKPNPSSRPRPAPATPRQARPAQPTERPISEVILIGASTGGVDALLTVLSRFPVDCPPTLIVQHTGPGFGESLTNLLDRQCPATVSLVTGPTPLRRGSVLMGAGTKTHLVLEGQSELRANCIQGGYVSGHIPSVDVLFESAVPHAAKITAALLTGMGKDGAKGLLELRKAGALTIAQDEASSVIYGMPRAAFEIGAANIQLPLDKVGSALLSPPSTRSRLMGAT